ncbi:MAG: mechanosensitive ion channel family protein [Candidatus Diapherotrites archaeon]
MFDIFTSIVDPMFPQMFYGIPLSRYLLFIGTMILFFIVGKIIYKLAQTVGRQITAKSKSNIDDLILDIVEEPIVFIFIIVGLQIAFAFLAITDVAILGLFDNITYILILLAVAYTAVKAVDHFLEQIIKPIVSKTDSKLDDQLMPIISKVLKIVIIGLTLLAILGHVGQDITAIIAGLGIGGLALAFAAQQTLSDIFGGFSIFTGKPFVTGDRVKFDGLDGVVEEVGLRNTRIRSLDGRLITIPNAKVASTAITNVSSEPARKVTVTLGTTYDTTVAKQKEALKILKEILASHKNITENPIIYFKEFADFSLNIDVFYWIEERDWGKITQTINDVNLEIKERFEKAKISFAFPTQTIELKK